MRSRGGPREAAGAGAAVTSAREILLEDFRHAYAAAVGGGGRAAFNSGEFIRRPLAARLAQPGVMK
jgi:hypothetical protein